MLSIISSQILAQSPGDSFESLQKLLSQNRPTDVIDKLAQPKPTITLEQINYLYTLSFDKLNYSLKALEYGQKYLQTFGGDDVERSLIVLEAILRNIYNERLTDKLNYAIDASDIIAFSEKNKNLAASLLHYLFLDNISLKNPSQSFNFYAADNKKLAKHFEYKIAEKLKFMPNSDFISEALQFIQSKRNLLFVRSFLAEKLIQEEKYPKAQSIIDGLQYFSGNSQYYTARLKKDLIRHSYKKPLKIGVMFPINKGKFNYVAKQLRAGLYYGLTKFRVSASELVLVFVNVGNSVEDAKKAYQDLVVEKEVNFVLGPVTKLATEALSTLVDRYGVPYLSYSVSADYNKINDASFIFQKDIKSELALLSKYSRHLLCKRKAAVLYSENNADQQALFTQEFKKLGGEIYKSYLVRNSKRDFIPIFAELSGKQVYQEGSSLKDTSKEAQTEEIIESGVDLILLALSAQDVGFVMNYAKVYSMEDLDFIGTSNINLPEVKYTKKASYPLWISDSVTRNPFNEDIFIELWKANIIDEDFDENSIYSIYGYLTASIFAKILKDNVFLGTATIRVILGSLKDFNSKLGNINTNAKRISITPSLTRVFGQDASPLANLDFNQDSATCTQELKEGP